MSCRDHTTHLHPASTRLAGFQAVHGSQLLLTELHDTQGVLHGGMQLLQPPGVSLTSGKQEELLSDSLQGTHVYTHMQAAAQAGGSTPVIAP